MSEEGGKHSMRLIRRLIRFVPILLSGGLSVRAVFKFLALVAVEPDLTGVRSKPPSLFVYTLH